MKQLFTVILFVALLPGTVLPQGSLRRVGSGESCAYADKNGNVVIPEGRYISSCAKIKSPVLLQSATSDSCFWVDASGDELYSVYMLGDRVDGFGGGRMRVEKDGKVGFVDKKGRVAVPLRYSAAERFSGKHALVSVSSAGLSATDLANAPAMDFRWGVVDKKGREVKPVRYQRSWSPELSRVVYISDADAFYFTEKGKIVPLE